MAIQQRRYQAEQMIGKALAQVVLNKIGFVEAHNSFINENLSAIQPSRGTAMRDSIIRGQGLILLLNDEFSLINAQNNWNFVHIVLTDGDDNESKATLEEVCALQLKIGASVPVSRLKTFFVGVDLDKSAQAIKEIAVITALGMENSEFISVNDAREIGSVFEKIKANLGVVQRTELAAVQSPQGAIIAGRTTNIPVLTIQKVNYVVLFNLDISGSMAGSRWTQVKQAVNSFVRQLDQDDFVGVIVFNNKSEIIDISKQTRAQTPKTNLSPQRQNIQLNIVPQPTQPQSRYVQNPNPKPNSKSRSKSSKGCCCIIY